MAEPAPWRPLCHVSLSFPAGASLGVMAAEGLALGPLGGRLSQSILSVSLSHEGRGERTGQVSWLQETFYLKITRALNGSRPTRKSAARAPQGGWQGGAEPAPDGRLSETAPVPPETPGFWWSHRWWSHRGRLHPGGRELEAPPHGEIAGNSPGTRARRSCENL